MTDTEDRQLDKNLENKVRKDAASLFFTKNVVFFRSSRMHANLFNLVLLPALRCFVGCDSRARRELTGRIFCTAVVILAGLTVDVVLVASLMATASTVSAGTTLSDDGILQKRANRHQSKSSTGEALVTFCCRGEKYVNISEFLCFRERRHPRREGPVFGERSGRG